MNTKMNNKNLLCTILVLCGILNVTGVVAAVTSSSVDQAPATLATLKKGEYYFFVDGSESGYTGYFPTISNGTNKLGIYKRQGWTGDTPIFTNITLKIGPENICGHPLTSYVTMRFFTSKDGTPMARVEGLKIGDESQLKIAFESALKIYGWVLYDAYPEKSPVLMSDFITTLINKINEKNENKGAISILNAAIIEYTKYVVKQFNNILTEASIDLTSPELIKEPDIQLQN